MGATGMTLPASRKRDTGEWKHTRDEVDVVHPMRGDEGEAREDVRVTEKMQRGVRREGGVL
jgi:hypothetical protein